MAIQFQKVSHTYNENTPFSSVALFDINVEIKEHVFTAIIGHTGSGKSTMVQHLNALLLPTSGSVVVDEYTLTPNKKIKEVKQLRKKVGLVFQFPEYQLFEDTIEKDIAFGPKNFGASEEEANAIAKQSLLKVGLDESYLQRSPFELSGGQKRRIAIAGILALNPDVLVLDEPTAGLDPQGAKEMMELFVRLQQDEKKTIIMVTHDMEHVYNYCEEVIVLKEGHVILQECTHAFFEKDDILEDLHITLPKTMQLKKLLLAKGIAIDKDSYTLEDVLKDALRGNKV